MERPVAELAQALAEHVLDQHVVVEVLEVHEAVERRTGMGVDRGAAVHRQRQFEIATHCTRRNMPHAGTFESRRGDSNP